MPRHLFRFAVQQFLDNGEGGSGAGTGDPAGKGAGSGAEGPTQADIDRLNGALTSERGLNAEIKRLAADKGVSVADLVAQLSGTKTPADDQKPDDQTTTALAEMQRKIDALTKSNEDSKREAQQATIKAELTTAATNAKARSTAAVVALLKDAIELDDAGKPKGVADAVEALKKSDPGLFNLGNRLDGGRPPRKAEDIKPGPDRLANYYDTESTTATSH